MVEEESLKAWQLINVKLRNGYNHACKTVLTHVLATYHVCNSVSSEVELCKSIEARESRHTRNLITSEVEHSQMGQVAQVLYFSDLEGE